MKSLSKFRLISCSYQCVNSSILLNPVSQPLRSVSDFHHCRRDRARTIVLADAFFVPSSLPPLLGCPCPVSPLRCHQKMSVFIAHNCAGGRAGEGAAGVVIVWYCAGEGLEAAGGGAGALYQARTGSRLLPTHRPWRLTTPPSPFFWLQTACGWHEKGDDDGETYQSAGGAKVRFLQLVRQF